MINYHPSHDMLLAHASGELELAMATAVSAHCELCPQCQQTLLQMTQRQAEQVLPLVDPTVEACETQVQLDDMMLNIMQTSTNVDAMPEAIDFTAHCTVTVKGEQFSLPTAFKQQVEHAWNGMGKVSRMRLEAEKGAPRASLLHIEAGGEIPEHTHQGCEITLLLEGHFEDEYHHYGPGDFIVLNGQHQHSPRTKEGCLCYTVVDAPLHFTKGISKLLNPIGELIY
ncbi:ChrR family anti-sigma-E factor [Shewanella sp.]|nr:ChrR family anti-sigma-E factor [Shewanella sp.]